MERPISPTIVTLTMNPAVDITSSVEEVRPTDKIRCADPRYDAGGGGINVAKVADVLGTSVCAIYPAGGSSGDLLTGLLARDAIPIRRITIEGATRESFTVNETRTGLQYRFVLPGPRVSFVEQQCCLRELRQQAASARFVVASGSLPPGAAENFYQQVALVCRDVGARLILDTSGCGLRHFTSGVFLLKASVHELRELAGRELATRSEQVAAARDIIACGQAETVVVSLGPDGGLLITGRQALWFPGIPMRTVVSGVGAGDAMVAAMTVGLSRDWSMNESVRYGIAAATAELLTPGSQPCTQADVERFFALADEPVVLADFGDRDTDVDVSLSGSGRQ
ncbi:1-phosphofructokinase family hexose kinase [Mycobacterium sp. 155]|uniref:1-phosphofructokinase family hexose kinase n=1 Tax=Mycobacterium sp. 155 TaxID=1157943 RepID=UPI0003A00546|nr:1-phosphofructokinase family hexose kinase [Mycobacterium sp. 155]